MRQILAAILFASTSLADAAPSHVAAAPDQPKVEPAPARREGEGPYPQLILRNVTVISGVGAPAIGPADIVIEVDRIVQVAPVGARITSHLENAATRGQ